MCAGAGAAALGDGVAKIVEKKFGCVLRQGYGMTELSPVATMSSLRKPVRRTTRHDTTLTAHTLTAHTTPHDTHCAHHTARHTVDR